MPAGLSKGGWGCDVASLLHERVAAVKPQPAFFSDDWTLVAPVCRRASGCVAIADCKRGDIGSTAEAYADLLLGPSSPIDAVTLNPYLGRDSLEPFVRVAAENDRGVFVLVKTSNPGSSDLQNLTTEPAGFAVAERVAELVREVGRDHVGDSGRSLVGAVVGLTVGAAEVARLRRLMPNTPFLMPGYGAQGGDPAVLRAALDSRGGGVLVSASRSLTTPWEGAAPWDWRERVLAALEAMRADLAVPQP